MFAKQFKSFTALAAADQLSIAALNTIDDIPLDFVIAEGQQAHTIGLVRFEDDGSYVKEFAGLQLALVGQSVKRVDKKKVKRKLLAKIEEMRQEHEAEGSLLEFNIDKETKKEIEENIIFAMLPDTEAEDFYNYVVVDVDTKIVYALNANKRVSEDISMFLRDALGSFPVVPFSVHEDLIIKGFGAIMEDREAERLTLGNYIKLEDSEGTVVWSKESLYESRASELMEDGKLVTAIGLEFDGVVEFVVSKDFNVKGIKFPKHFNDEEGTIEASVLLCFNEVRGLMEDLIKATIQK